MAAPAGSNWSRAAAMVINFNLLLVWLPMCKYTLTRLAVFAFRSASKEKEKLHRLTTSSAAGRQDQVHVAGKTSSPLDLTHRTDRSQLACYNEFRTGDNQKPAIGCSAEQLKWSIGLAVRKIKHALCLLKIKSIGSFLIAVDHCTSLHTICATTITIASGESLQFN